MKISPFFIRYQHVFTGQLNFMKIRWKKEKLEEYRVKKVGL